jgi:hypothetical protein
MPWEPGTGRQVQGQVAAISSLGFAGLSPRPFDIILPAFPPKPVVGNCCPELMKRRRVRRQS